MAARRRRGRTADYFFLENNYDRHLSDRRKTVNANLSDTELQRAPACPLCDRPQRAFGTSPCI